MRMTSRSGRSVLGREEVRFVAERGKLPGGL